MSSKLGMVNGHSPNRDIRVTSFFDETEGVSRESVGQSLQLVQGNFNQNNHFINLDKAQVVEMVEKMQAWLERS